MGNTKGATIVSVDEIDKLRYPLPKSWIRAAGLLNHGKGVLGSHRGSKLIAGKGLREAASLYYSIKRDLGAWRAIRGIWKGKRMVNPVAWQRKIRKEWERKLI